MVGKDQGNLGPKVFFVWGALCVGCWIYAYFLIPETKGLSIEQVDRMLEETTPRTSAKWKPHTTDKGTLAPEIVEDVERKGSVVGREVSTQGSIEYFNGRNEKEHVREG